MLQKTEPITARASAAGRGGIGIVRLSGQPGDVLGIAKRMLPNLTLRPRHAHLSSLTESSGEVIDQTIILYFPALHSYTGEAVLEFQSHGGQVVIERIIHRILEAGEAYGVRLARPGEFTERAFLNGRMDLSQAEAVADLIDAGSVASARAAARSLQGAFSQKIKKLNEDLLSLRTYVEATLDFPEEEIDFIEQGHIRERVAALLDELEQIHQRAMRGKTLRDGLSVVLVGEPNVGKSSLMNALAGEDISIVTDVAGTTRDKIECEVTLDGLLVKITDTAGLRDTQDVVEAIGVDRAKKAVENADVVLILKDARETETEQNPMEFLKGHLRQGVDFISVFNKIDLNPNQKDRETGAFYISAKTGQGLDKLVAKLKSLAGAESAEGDFLARTRHLECLARAKQSLEKVSDGLHDMNLEIVAEEMRLSGIALGEIVGQTLPDDLLGKIFSSFCIGK